MFKKLALALLGWLILSSGTAYAYTVGEVYGWCKPFADKAFVGREVTDGVCLSYVNGFRDTQQLTCEMLKFHLSEGSISKDDKIWLNRDFFASDADDIKATIQSFVNWAADNPDKWSEEFTSRGFYWMSNDYPCEAE